MHLQLGRFFRLYSSRLIVVCLYWPNTAFSSHKWWLNYGMLLIVLDCDIIQCIFFQGDMTCRCNYVSFCVLLMCTLNGSLILQAVFHIIVETWEVIGAAPLKMKRKASCCSLKGHQWPLRLQTSRLVSFYIFLHFAIYGILWLSLPYCYLSSSHHGFSVNIAMGTQMYKGEGGLGKVITLHCSVNAGAYFPLQCTLQTFLD